MGFMGLHAFTSCGTSNQNSTILSSFPENLSEGYGPLLDDPDGILKLPEGFSYKIISKMGDQMTDGFLVPGDADGMATFPGPNGKTVIVRNHELSPNELEKSGFGSANELIDKIPSSKFYDFGRGETPCLGGTTTIVYDVKTQEVITEYLSLAGTVRNCAGGPTPWGTWITCEENVYKADDKLEKDHGYAFEVPATDQPQLFDPIPISDMGRFYREAVCVDPETSIVYQTEDLSDGLLYRYLPNVPGQLHKGGKLQVLALVDNPQMDTRNWDEPDTVRMEIGKKYPVKWLDIDDVHSPEDDLRYRGFEKGAARFARGEGAWFGNGEAYFACTNGGSEKQGQVFKYKPSPNEGKANENDEPGTIELFIEPNDSKIVSHCDNVTMDPNGHIILNEDTGSPRISGITPNGNIYHIAHNVGYESEFAGSCFSPDGSTMFVNIQGPGLTLAITGPWEKGANFS